MKEKERYKVSVGSDYITICGYEENRIKALDNCGMQSLLNLQDNQIKAKGKEANTYAKEIVFLDNKIKLLERENQQLKKQLARTEKALELACDLIKCMAIVAKQYIPEEPNYKIKDVEYFKQQAKEMLENE